MSKNVQDRGIVNIEGRPIRVPKRDEDGDIVWKDRCHLCETPAPQSEPEYEPLTTVAAIRMLVFGVPAEARKQNDSENSYRIMQAVAGLSQSKGNSIACEDHDYEFLHRLFDRELPLAYDAPENATPETMGSALWGINSWVVAQQMTENGIEIPKAKEAVL